MSTGCPFDLAVSEHRERRRPEGAHGGTDAADAATRHARAWLDQHSAGSGPFVLEAWEHGSQLTLARNPHYWGKQPPFERVVFKFVKDANVQRDLLVRGDAHFAANLSPDLAADLQGKPNIGMLKCPRSASRGSELQERHRQSGAQDAEILGSDQVRDRL